MPDWVVDFDTNLFLWVNSRHNLFWDLFMSCASGKFIWGPLYIAIIFGLWRAIGFKAMVAAVVICCLMVLLADQLTASFLRPYIGRLRPSHVESPVSDIVHLVQGYRGGAFGFPSSHAANTFAVATLMSLLFKRWYFSCSIFIWACLNCYSRSYLGLHYPGDLVVGMVIGALCGFLGYILQCYLVNMLKLKMRGPGSFPVFKSNDKIYYLAPSGIVVIVEILTIVGLFIYSGVNS